MAVKNPRKVFPSFKTACLKKAKEVRDFVNKHASVDLNPRKVLQLESLQADLRDQFKRMQRDWDNAKADIADDIVFDEVEAMVNTAEEAVGTALYEAERLLDETERLTQTSTAPADTTSSIKAVKLPVFWTEEPEIWFSQAEANFRSKGVTTEVSKFNNVVAHLDATTAALASDIIKAVPREENNPYAKLKKRILEALSLSCNEKADRLLDLNGFGDKIPSQGLQAMLKLVPEAEAEEPGFLFRRIFLRQLTPEVRNNLAQTEHTANTVGSLRLLAKQADHYYHSTGARINAVDASVGFDDRELGVDAVTGRVLCFIHKKYGSKATSCRKAKGERCDWVTKPTKRSQGNANGRA